MRSPGHLGPGLKKKRWETPKKKEGHEEALTEKLRGKKIKGRFSKRRALWGGQLTGKERSTELKESVLNGKGAQQPALVGEEEIKIGGLPPENVKKL